MFHFLLPQPIFNRPALSPSHTSPVVFGAMANRLRQIQGHLLASAARLGRAWGGDLEFPDFSDPAGFQRPTVSHVRSWKRQKRTNKHTVTRQRPAQETEKEPSTPGRHSVRTSECPNSWIGCPALPVGEGWVIQDQKEIWSSSFQSDKSGPCRPTVLESVCFRQPSKHRKGGTDGSELVSRGCRRLWRPGDAPRGLRGCGLRSAREGHEGVHEQRAL